jgi:hypothetical protein
VGAARKGARGADFRAIPGFGFTARAMAAPDVLVSLLACFVEYFTRPGFNHFRHLALGFCCTYPGAPVCLTQALRATGWHEDKHWTGLYRFLSRVLISR